MTDLPPTDEPAVPAAAPEEEHIPVFDFNEDRKFDLYMAQRDNHAKGARDAYQRVDQIIIGVSAGAIVLSISFLKDIGHAPDTLKFLLASWGFLLGAGFCALLSLWTSAEQDRASIVQLDGEMATGKREDAKCKRFRRATMILNGFSFSFMIFGVLLMITFAYQNVVHFGGPAWPAAKQAAPAASPVPAIPASSSGTATPATLSQTLASPKPPEPAPKAR